MTTPTMEWMIAERKNSSVTKVGMRPTISMGSLATQPLQEKRLGSQKRKRRRRRTPTEVTLTPVLLPKLLKKIRKRIIRRSPKLLRIMAAPKTTF